MKSTNFLLNIPTYISTAYNRPPDYIFTYCIGDDHYITDLLSLIKNKPAPEARKFTRSKSN